MKCRFTHGHASEWRNLTVADQIANQMRGQGRPGLPRTPSAWPPTKETACAKPWTSARARHFPMWH